MTYTIIKSPGIALPGSISRNVATFRDTSFRFACDGSYMTLDGAAVTSITDPTSGTTRSAVGGGANRIGIPYTQGAFTVLRTPNAGTASNSRPGVNVGVLPWRGLAGFTVAAIVSFDLTLLTGGTYGSQCILGDFSASSGGTAYWRFGSSGAQPGIIAKHTSLGETSYLTTVLPRHGAGKYMGLIARCSATTGLMTLEDAISGQTVTAQGDPAIWNTVFGNPATGASFFLSRGNSGSTGNPFLGDITDAFYWPELRTTAQLDHLRKYMRARVAKLGV